MPGFFVNADDVLVGGRLVVEAQERVPLLSELLVLRVQPHLLSMRLKARASQDSTHGRFTRGYADGRQVLGQQRRRPMRHRNADVLGRSARFGDNQGAVGVRERARGRPSRGASASIATGVAFAKPATPFLCRPLVNLERPGDPVGWHSVRHHQQRAPAQVNALLDLRPTKERLDVLTLLRRERDGHRRATARSASRPRCCMIMSHRCQREASMESFRSSDPYVWADKVGHKRHGTT